MDDENDDLVDDVLSSAKEDAQREKSDLASGKSETTKGTNMVKDKVLQASKEKVAKNATKKVAEKMVANSMLSLGPLLPYIGIAIAVILIIIAIIGIIGFLTTVPGLMKDKLHSFGKSIGIGFRSLYNTSANAATTDDEILELAKYINEMGYDLMGFGFVTPKDHTQVITSDYLESQGYTVEENQDDGTVKYKKGNSYWEEDFIYKDGHSYNGKTGKKVEYVSYKDAERK